MEGNVDREKFLKLDKYVILILALIILDLEIFGSFGTIDPFRDYVVVFEGGYRILFGQIQSIDFYFPTGPMVFLVQALFNLVIGNNFFSMIVHSFFLAIILCTIFYYLVRKEFGIIMSLIFAIFFYLSFNGLTFQPWYDHVAYFFFFLNIFLLFKYHKKSILPKSVYFLSALLITLAFYSKQDVGLLQAFFVLFYFIFNYHKEFKSIVKHYVIPLIFLSGGIYFLLSFFTDFAYWFNLGQAPHTARFSHFFITIKAFNIITSWKLYVALFLIYKTISDKIKDRNIDSIKLMCLFVIVAITPLITQVTSRSHIQTLVMGIPFLVFILYLLIKNSISESIKKNGFVIGFILLIVLILTVNPFPVYGKSFLSYADGDLGRIDEGCYSGVLFSNDALEGLSKIRKVIEENENDFISFTEYQFLYCDYDVEPPRDLPLCFMEGVCFFNENVPHIIKILEKKSPKVILLQNHHGHYNKTLDMEFKESFYGWRYEKVDSVKAMASHSDIDIFVR